MKRFSRRKFILGSAQASALTMLASCIRPVQAHSNPQAPAYVSQTDAAHKPPRPAQEQPIPIPDMPLEAKIGQMILIGFPGTTLPEDAEILDAARMGRVGGVVLFGHNVRESEQVRALTAQLQAAAQQSAAAVPLLVSIDQEGGLVSRLGAWAGLATNHSAQFLGTVNNLATTRAQSTNTAGILRSLGVNLNLAPVVDLNRNVFNPVIGGVQRAYSANPARVVEHARQFIDGHREQGVGCTLKHFPGHGSSDDDSHLGFVDVTDSWQEVELSPYITLIAENTVDAVMSAHIFNARLDPDFPATLSHKVMTGILREQLGFQGVIVSDDMRMRAISDLYEPADAVYRAIEAGVDIIAISNNISGKMPISPTQAYQTLLDHVGTGLISRERIDQSYQRIMRLKAKLGMLPAA